MTWRATSNRLRCYHRMRRWPEGLFALGDAVATLNPIYGQGMTLAALGAVALAAECGKGRDLRSSRCFQRRLARINLVPWLLATSEDSRFAGGAPMSARIARFYTERLRRRIPSDPVLALAFMKTLQLTEPLASLRPAAIFRAMRPAGYGGSRQLDLAEVLARVEDD
jgi:2-polyprenyl-6-methoxyphenol hydroxylase-like FAD-dependent oxidoreductase